MDWFGYAKGSVEGNIIAERSARGKLGSVTLVGDFGKESCCDAPVAIENVVLLVADGDCAVAHNGSGGFIGLSDVASNDLRTGVVWLPREGLPNPGIISGYVFARRGCWDFIASLGLQSGFWNTSRSARKSGDGA